VLGKEPRLDVGPAQAVPRRGVLDGDAERGLPHEAGPASRHRDHARPTDEPRLVVASDQALRRPCRGRLGLLRLKMRTRRTPRPRSGRCSSQSSPGPSPSPSRLRVSRALQRGQWSRRFPPQSGNRTTKVVSEQRGAICVRGRSIAMTMEGAEAEQWTVAVGKAARDE
jgi:hypothetical protein